MKKYIAAFALMFVSVAAVDAAPSLGVTWRKSNDKGKGSGVKIASVEPGSNGEELGLRVGEFVFAVNGIIVKTGAEATAEVQKAKGKLSLALLDDNKIPYFINAEIEEPVKGLVADPNAKAKYKNITKTKK
jgi:S1-C subfamily serine protease